MTHRATFTITDENQAFLAKLPRRKRSAYINVLLDQNRQKVLEEEIVRANLEEAEDQEYREEFKIWDSTVLDGLSDG